VLSLFTTGAKPKQIEVALRQRHGLDLTRHVSHETIYDFIYIHSTSRVKKELIAYLRRKKLPLTPAPRAKGKLSGQLPGASREVPGQWAADIVTSAGNCTANLVITERVSRYAIIVQLGAAKDAVSDFRAIIKALKTLPAHLRKTHTHDKGREMAQHAAFSIATKVAVYFCDPHSPWQQGPVENINGLIREYFPKGIDINSFTKGQIAKAEWRLNNRPRIVHDGQSPAEVFHHALQKNCALAA